MELTENQRLCPKCNSIMEYTGVQAKKNKKQADKRGRICKKCISSLYIERFKISHPARGKKISGAGRKNMSLAKKGKKLTGKRLEISQAAAKKAIEATRGKSVFDRWVKKYGKEVAIEKEKQRRIAISKVTKGDKNPMYGKTRSPGIGKGWASWYKNHLFRSLRELCYFIFEIENKKLKWRTAETKDLMIEYFDENNQKRTYVADFLVEDHILIDIKPRSEWNIPRVIAKINAAKTFCQKMGFEYKIIDFYLNNKILVEKYKAGEITFVGNGKEKFEKRWKPLLKPLE